MRPNELCPEEIIESYYLETQEGLFFAVKGLEHPPDRLISVLRYVPDREKGERKKGNAAYRRLYHFSEQEELLQSSYPHYLAYDSTFQTTLQSVPWSFVRRVYDPRSRLKELHANAATDILEAQAVAFTSLLQREAGIPPSGIGITGSLLIGLHRDSSDLDLSVFGAQNCRNVYSALSRALASPSFGEVRRFNSVEIEELYGQRISDTLMEYSDFVHLEKNKICQGVFRDRPYFIRFIRTLDEVGEKYGSVRYAALGHATITATISNGDDSIFTPCRYLLSDVTICEGPDIKIESIVSFRGRFCEQAQTGDRVQASGTLERIVYPSGKSYYRLLLGNSIADKMVGQPS